MHVQRRILLEVQNCSADDRDPRVFDWKILRRVTSVVKFHDFFTFQTEIFHRAPLYM